MRRFFLVLLSLVTISSPAARRYTMRLIDDGTMLFFFPQKLTASEKGHSFVYDINYNTSRDSVVFNMTYTASDSDIHLIRLKAGSVSYESTDFRVFYRERKMKSIATRINVCCPKDVFEYIFQSEEPLIFEVETNSGNVSHFFYKKSKWQKEKTCVSEAILLAK